LFSADLQKVNDHLCYKCYRAPNTLKFEVKLHEIKLGGLSSIMIYVDGTQHHITRDCGVCSSDSGENLRYPNKNDSAVCHHCQLITSGIMFELYLQLNPQVQTSSEGESPCPNIAKFNISLSMNTDKPDVEVASDCDDGFRVSLPLAGDTCIVNSTFFGTETHCLVPTCSDGIRSPDDSNEKIEYKFQPHKSAESCVWQLNTEQRKHVTLTFSLSIKPHITVFEESLMNPKWDIEWCPTYDNDFRMVTDTDTVFVVYHSSTKLTKKGSLSITTQTDLCILPPPLENGSVEFQRLESGTVAHYMCDKGFSLFGPLKLHCKNGGDWDEPPICVHLKKQPDFQLLWQLLLQYLL
ncbi:putative Sushi repeat (SCR repeat)-containing protein 1, partial [Homarus americanus]